MVKIVFEAFFMIVISKVFYLLTYKYVSRITVSKYLDHLK